ncbi:hypothetical protein [Lentzea roselyniae]|uniref:hypothetical protein n=1 Tax=Lentzea roselyniae TaxID=531940 RepID=UPI0031F83500
MYTGSNTPNTSGTAQTVEVIARTWATQGTEKNSVNHTERQLDTWLTSQGDDFLRRITAMELHSRYSACTNCTDVLIGLRRKLPSAVLVFHWRDLYVPKDDSPSRRRQVSQTAAAYLSELEKVGWRLTGRRS